MWLEKRPKVGEDGLMSYEDSASNFAEKLRPADFFDSKKQTSEEARGKKKEKRTGNSVVPRAMFFAYGESVSHHLIFALCHLLTFCLSHQV